MLDSCSVADTKAKLGPGDRTIVLKRSTALNFILPSWNNDFLSPPGCISGLSLSISPSFLSALSFISKPAYGLATKVDRNTTRVVKDYRSLRELAKIPKERQTE